MKVVPKTSVIIVGAGVAGLACARQLEQEGVDFLLISPSLGGRVITSVEGAVNYGAYILADTHRHILEFAQKGRRLHLFKLHFHHQAREYGFFSALMKNEFELIRFMRSVQHFQRDYLAFQNDAATLGQQAAFARYPFLEELYHTSAEVFIEERRLTHIIHDYIAEVVTMCTFTPLASLNAFNLMQIAMYVDIPVHEFVLDVSKMAAPVMKQVISDVVEKVDRSGKDIVVTTHSNRILYCDHLVVATPLEVTKKWFPISLDRQSAHAYLFHIRGIAKPEWSDGDLELFDETSSTIFISRQNDGTVIFYSRDAHPKLEEFFIEHQVIAQKEWNPAFHVGGHKIQSPDLDDRITLAGDFNIIGLEDSYISGLYAARRARISVA